MAVMRRSTFNRFLSFAALAAVVALLSACAHQVAKPNGAQKWGVWSKFPWTQSHKAKMAERKDDGLEESRRQLTLLCYDLLSYSLATDPAVTAAKEVAKQNVVL